MTASVNGHSCKNIIIVSSLQMRHQAIACEFLFEVEHEDVGQKGAKRGAGPEKVEEMLFLELN